MGLNDDIYTKLRNWVYHILITEEGLGLPIIQSRQNTPAPDGTYIVIDRFVGAGNIGRETKVYPPDDEGRTKIANDWEGNVEIWEIDGEGDLLRMLVNSLGRAEIQQTYFQAEGIVTRGVIGVTNIPRLDDDFWTEQAMFEMRIGFADVTTEQSGWIETVNYTGDIKHE